MERAARLAVQREDLLEERTAEERQTFEKFAQGAQADIAPAFIQDLTRLRLAYFNALVDQLELRRVAGIERDSLRSYLETRARLILDRLTGQIRLDAMSLNELRSRLVDKPNDEDLAHALALVQEKQSRNLEGLEAIIEIADRLGFETAEPRSLLLHERGRIGVAILEREVFTALWNENIEALQRDLTRSGPDLVLNAGLFVAIVLVAFLIARAFRLPVRSLLTRRHFGTSALLRELLVSLSSLAVFVAGLIIALASIGVSLGPLLAGIGVLSLLVGLAVQDALANLAAGVMILLYAPMTWTTISR